MLFLRRLSIFTIAFTDLLVLTFWHFPITRQLGDASDGTWIAVTGIALFYVSAIFMLCLVSKNVRAFLTPHGFRLIDKAALLVISGYAIYVGYLLFMLYSGGAI